MLKYWTRQPHVPPTGLSPADDKTLRLAFGRYAEHKYRHDAKLIAAYHDDLNRCLVCDCQSGVEQAPLLFFVSGTHIKRQAIGKGTPHKDTCDFFRNDQQAKIIRTHKPRSLDDRYLRLVRNFTDEEDEPRVTIPVTTRQPRPPLARVLCDLLYRANLHNLQATTPISGWVEGHEQEKIALMRAAETFSLTSEQFLSNWIALALRDYYDFKQRLERSIGIWPRPHGVFIESFDRIENNILYPKDATKRSIEVLGELKVFGEGEFLRRPPYLVIGIVTQPHRDATEVALLNAYAHPCIGWDRWMLVDSELERDTLQLLVTCRKELASNHQIVVTIEKPLFDVGEVETEDSRAICKPDFILHCQGNRVVNAVLDCADGDHRSLDPLFLQRLIYVAEGWRLALTGVEFISDPICVWDFGPMVMELKDALQSLKANHIPHGWCLMEPVAFSAKFIVSLRDP